MESVRRVTMLCLVLAFVTPAVAEIYMFSESMGDGSWTNSSFLGSTVAYDPDPDPLVVDEFWDGYSSYFNTPPTASPFKWAPWYTNTPVPAGIVPGPSDEIRSSMGGGSLRVRGSVGFNANVGAIRYGDQYWPNQIAGGVNYHFSGGRWDGNYNINVGTMYHGRNDSEALNNSNVAPMAIVTSFNVRAEAGTPANTNIGQIKMLRDSTLRGSLAANQPSMLMISTRSHGQANPTHLSLNIGDIYLNQELLYLELTGGTTTISGSIGLMDGASSGNLITLITGVPAAIGEDPKPSAILNLAWSELYEMIDAGQLYAYPVTGLAFARTYMDNGGEGFYTRLASGAIRPITRQNMRSELLITTADNGLASVRMIPEPATLTLLAFGGLVLVRRRRA